MDANVASAWEREGGRAARSKSCQNISKISDGSQTPDLGRRDCCLSIFLFFPFPTAKDNCWPIL